MKPDITICTEIILSCSSDTLEGIAERAIEKVYCNDDIATLKKLASQINQRLAEIELYSNQE